MLSLIYQSCIQRWSYEEQNEKLEGLDITKVSRCMLPLEIFGNVVFWDHFWCILFLNTLLWGCMSGRWASVSPHLPLAFLNSISLACIFLLKLRPPLIA